MSVGFTRGWRPSEAPPQCDVQGLQCLGHCFRHCSLLWGRCEWMRRLAFGPGDSPERGSDTQDKVIDVAADCVDAGDPNKWRVDLNAGNNTVDGTHPASALHTIMAARVNVAASTWTAH